MRVNSDGKKNARKERGTGKEDKEEREIGV